MQVVVLHRALMPLMLSALVMFGVKQSDGLEIALIVPWCIDADCWSDVLESSRDCPQGDFKELRAQGIQVGSDKKVELPF